MSVTTGDTKPNDGIKIGVGLKKDQAIAGFEVADNEPVPDNWVTKELKDYASSGGRCLSMRV